MKLNWLTKNFYRNKVLGIVIDKHGEFLVDSLVSYDKDDWNFPGGGIETGETDEEAIIRELKEELGTNKFKILDKGKEFSTYNWPIKLVLKKSINIKRILRGQRVRHFLVSFTGKRNEIKPDSREIREIKWIKRSEFKKYLRFPNQLKSIERELKEFGMG